jgi:hypothetical protein
MSKFLFFFFFLSSVVVYSQSFSWQGKILEEKTSKPIEYAHVIVYNDGNKLYFISDNNGFVSVFYSNSTVNDSIVVSHLSYNTILLNSKELVAKKVIELTNKTRTLDEVKIKPAKERNIIIGPKFSVFKSGAHLCSKTERVVYFPPAMYEKGILKKVEFSFSNDDIFPDKGDTVGRKMPIMLKIYARDTVNNIPEKELLKDTILFFPQKKDKKMQVDISEYGIILPSEGFYCGFASLPTEWYIAHGYFTLETMKYPLPPPVHYGFHCPNIAMTSNKKEVEKYELYEIGGHLKKWTKSTRKSTLAIRLHICD